MPIFDPDYLKYMTAVSNFLLLVSVLRWVNYGLFDALNSGRVIKQAAHPEPMFDEVPVANFEDIYDGSIERLSYRLNRTEAAVVLFYAPWSRSSIHFKPIFEKLAMKHAHQNFDFIAINCWQPGGGTCRQAFSLKGGYPYISMFTHATGHIFYNGVLSEHEILLFLYKYTFPFHYAADLKTLAAYRLLSPSQILIVLPMNESLPSVESKMPRHFAQAARDVTKSSAKSYRISTDIFKVGIRSVMIGSTAVFVPMSLFPTLPQARAGIPHFYMPNLQLGIIPANWTGWLPPLKPAKLKPPKNETEEQAIQELPLVDRGVDRAVVAVVNSFLPHSGPQLCSPGVALLRAASWLHDSCIGPNNTHADVLAEVTIGLSMEKERCEQLSTLSREQARFGPTRFHILEDGGEELSKLAEIAGLGCITDNANENDVENVFTYKRFQVEHLQTQFAAVEHHSGVGVIHNFSATPTGNSHVGPRKPLRIEPAIYLMDGRQESRVRLINVSTPESEVQAVDHLVNWIKEKFHQEDDESPSKEISGLPMRIRLPAWMPITERPTLVFYEAPWCVFCGVVTPRVRLAVQTLERILPRGLWLVRVTDAEQIDEPILYGSQERKADRSSNVFSVPHYPSLVLFPHGTKHSVSHVIPHSPGSQIVPAIWHHLPLIDKLLTCTSASNDRFSCLKRQLKRLVRLQHRLWAHQDSLLAVEEINPQAACPQHRLQLLRFLSNLRTNLMSFDVMNESHSSTSLLAANFRMLAKSYEKYTALNLATAKRLLSSNIGCF